MVVQQERFTIDEAAEYLRLSKRTIYRLCQEGELVGHRTSRRGCWRFRKEDLDKALRKGIPEDETKELVALTATADPVLAEIWDNEKDKAYDRV
ncbi:MAG: helix-turn-helix domain-containing protein [Chloroflexi bacterium]|nr:helix-turn-helix domain-containing protein [Chloroflexota bacterium]